VPLGEDTLYSALLTPPESRVNSKGGAKKSDAAATSDAGDADVTSVTGGEGAKG
jgi:hypothetical protein